MQLKLFGNVVYQVQKHRDYRQKIILNYQVQFDAWFVLIVFHCSSRGEMVTLFLLILL